MGAQNTRQGAPTRWGTFALPLAGLGLTVVGAVVATLVMGGSTGASVAAAPVITPTPQTLTKKIVAPDYGVPGDDETVVEVPVEFDEQAAQDGRVAPRPQANALRNRAAEDNSAKLFRKGDTNEWKPPREPSRPSKKEPKPTVAPPTPKPTSKPSTKPSKTPTKAPTATQAPTTTAPGDTPTKTPTPTATTPTSTTTTKPAPTTTTPAPTTTTKPAPTTTTKPAPTTTTQPAPEPEPEPTTTPTTPAPEPEPTTTIPDPPGVPTQPGGDE